MARAWFIDGRSIARKVSRFSTSQIKDCGANRECPKCHCRIDNSDVSQEWPGLPVGVKFDPSDPQLLEHLEAKCAVGNSKPHVFIDEFIPTLDGDKGICYTHPAKLPGAKKDGSSVHFFHRTTNAYATGQRKRRKVHRELSSNEENVRWHKTGKTKSVMDNGVQKGCKKIMVLYKSSKKGSKPDKSNWVMHQYHLGTDEDEREGEYVVSKVFYQQKQTEKNDDIVLTEDNDILSHQTSPRTPNPNPPNPPRPGTSVMYDDVADDNIMQLAVQKKEIKEEAPVVPVDVFQLEGDVEYPEWFAGESQGVENTDFNGFDDSLLCNEILDSALRVPINSGVNPVSYTGSAHNTNEVKENNNEPCGIADLENLELDTPPEWFAGESQAVENTDFNGFDDSLLCNEIFDSAPRLPNNSGVNPVSYTGSAHNTNEVKDNNNEPCGIADLENLELDTPPDFQLADLQFGSQETVWNYQHFFSGMKLAFEYCFKGKSVPGAATVVWRKWGSLVILCRGLNLCFYKLCRTLAPFSTSTGAAQQAKAVEATIQSLAISVRWYSTYSYDLNIVIV
ncbi:unnamed protein product [Dovyalis caffra]|uniref:NAC domain-containing protein n=1 Tax=Dovyalis caffra TaxID=77055 RepID=A0AAV1R2B6_9ROSI|nr:unnamed protein product [Dovyalis caffra]